MIQVSVYQKEQFVSVLPAQPGDNLLQVLQSGGFMQQVSCGGKGICGQCRVKLLSEMPAPSATERTIFQAEELRKGWRLACHIKVQRNLKVMLEEDRTSPEVLFQRTLVETKRSVPHEKRESNEDASKDTSVLYENLFVTIDLGTTTLAMELRSTSSTKILAQYAALNPQRVYGADVISRVEAARNQDGAREILQKSVQKEIEKGLLYFQKQMEQAWGNALQEEHEAIQKARMDWLTVPLFVAGNSVMEHLLLGLDIEGFCAYPFPCDCQSFVQTEIASHKTYVLPGISAFVGADIVADLYALGMLPGLEKEEKKEPKLLIDLGTNAEMGYYTSGQLMVSATAAGPAFEGGITAGIFGADLVEIVAKLLVNEKVNQTGLLQETTREQEILVDGITIRQSDIRQLQLAKAAVAAGVEILTQSGANMGKQPDQDLVVYLAGGFGYHLQVEGAKTIGLLPHISADAVHTVGNMVLQGVYEIACETLQDIFFITRLQNAISKVQVINLAEQENFHEVYVKHIDFGESE